MHQAENLALNYTLRLDHFVPVLEVELRRTGAPRLVQVGLGLSQVSVFSRRQQTNRDIATGGLEGQGIEEPIVVHKEVDMDPEGVSQDDFGKLVVRLTPVLWRGIVARWLLGQSVGGEKLA